MKSAAFSVPGRGTYAAETILRQILVGADQKVSRAAFGGSLFLDGDGAPKARNLGRVLINPPSRPGR